MHDLYHDPGHGRLRHLLETHPRAAELLKTAEFEDESSEIPKTAFAWDARSLYPVHTPEHAVVSYLYAKTASEYGDKTVPREVLAKIAESIEFYEISMDAFETTRIKEAALTEDECLFPEQNAFPIRTAGEVKTAEARLFEELPKLHPETRAASFYRLTKRAQDLGVELRPESYKYAGLTLTNASELVRELEARVVATKVAAVKEGYTKLASAIVSDRKALRSRDMQVKLAQAIGTLDEQGHLVGLYDKKVRDPLVTVFNTTKLASEHTAALGDHAFSDTQLASMPASFYGDILGQDIVSEIAPQGHVDVQKLKAIIETLPSDLKQMLTSHLKSHTG